MGQFIVSAPIISLSVRHSHPPVPALLFVPAHLPAFSCRSPGLTSILHSLSNYFAFPFLSVSLSSLHLSLSPPHPHRHPSLPILIALATGGHSEAGLTAGCIVSASFIVRGVYKKREQSSVENGEIVEALFPFQRALPVWLTYTNSYCTEEIKETLHNVSNPGCSRLKDLTHSIHESSRCRTVAGI